MKKYVVFEINDGLMGDFYKTLTENFGEDLRKYYRGAKNLLDTGIGEKEFYQRLDELMELHLDETVSWVAMSLLATFKAAGYIKLPEHIEYVQEVLDGTREFHYKDKESVDIFEYFGDVYKKTGDENLAKWIGADYEFSKACYELYK